MLNDKILFQVDKLSFKRNNQTIISDLSIILHAGEIVGIYGINASAKTTLLSLLSGRISASSGTFKINDKVISKYNVHTATKAGVTLISGDEGIYPNLNVAENIIIGKDTIRAFPFYYNKKKSSEIVKKLLLEYGCTFSADNSISALTIAEKQVVLVLRAIANSASIILIDDVLDAMDLPGRAFFGKFLYQLATEGKVVLIASQNKYYLKKIVNTMYLLKNGTLFTDEISNLPFLNQRSKFPYPRININIGDVIYECNNLSYLDILQNISLSVHKGELVGVVGASNSGRTVLAHLISGYLAATSGTTKIYGQSVKITSSSAARKYGISLIANNFSYNNLIPEMSLEDNIFLGNIHEITLRYLPFIISQNKQNKLSKHLLTNVGFNPSSSNVKANILSNGMQKKVAFCRSILSGAQLIVLDEPSSGIDESGRIQIYNIINSLLLNEKGIILCTSDISEAIGMCNRIILLKQGKMLDDIPAAQTSFEEVSKLIYS